MNLTSGCVVHTIRLQRLRAAMIARLPLLVAAAAADVVAAMREEIESGVKSGRLYVRPGGLHQASAPGEAPANDAGVLLAGLSHRMVSTLMASIRSDAPYSAELEFGGMKYAPRPFMLPALQKVNRPFRLAVYKVLDSARR